VFTALLLDGRHRIGAPFAGQFVEIFGDRLTETPISGSTPRLNDTYTVGGKYNYNFNGNFGAQFQFGYSPRVTTGCHPAATSRHPWMLPCSRKPNGRISSR
jgi:hypothetical protein